MRKKLYLVTRTLATCVYAESKNEAVEAIKYEDLEGEFEDEASELLIHDGKPILPKCWGKNCIPWGSDDDSTISNILAKQN